MNNVNEINDLLAERNCGEAPPIYNRDLRAAPHGASLRFVEVFR